MKIVVENLSFDFERGRRLLKMKYDAPPFPQVEEGWDEIKPMTFMEIAQMENIEERRVGILCLGLERLVKEIEPELVNVETIEKENSYIDKDGKTVNYKFLDTYQLYKVSGSKFGTNDFGRSAQDCYFVKMKDTSTEREYLIWIDPHDVLMTNSGERYFREASQINAIQSVAWTIQTTVREGNVEKIVRQGDCILVKPKDPSKPMLDSPRHLTEKEYRSFMVAES